MSREEIIRFIQSFNSSLDVEFLESLSKTQLSGYAQHLKAVRMKTGGRMEPMETRAADSTTLANRG
jgi:hypothetical protein